MRPIKGRYYEVLSPQPWEVSFRETNDVGSFDRSFGQEPLDLAQALVKV